jgi:hypothetical protein
MPIGTMELEQRAKRKTRTQQLPRTPRRGFANGSETDGVAISNRPPNKHAASTVFVVTASMVAGSGNYRGICASKKK